MTVIILSPETFDFLAYHRPMDVTVTVSEAEAGVTFYYIAATNGMTQIVISFSGAQSIPTFSVVFMASETSSLSMSILRNGDEIVDDSQVSFIMTVIGTYMYNVYVNIIICVVSIRALDFKP